MKALLLQWLALAAVVAAATFAVHTWHPNRPALYLDPQPLNAGEVELAAALAWRDAGQIVWIDARRREKYDAGHVEGAILLNEQDDFNALFFEAIADLQNNADKHFVVYCSSSTCTASARIAVMLRDRGFPEVHVLKGGVVSLRAGGLLGSNYSGARSAGKR